MFYATTVRSCKLIPRRLVIRREEDTKTLAYGFCRLQLAKVKNMGPGVVYHSLEIKARLGTANHPEELRYSQIA